MAHGRNGLIVSVQAEEFSRDSGTAGVIQSPPFDFAPQESQIPRPVCRRKCDRQGRGTLEIGLPTGFDFWRVQQGLEYDAVLLSLFLQRLQLFGGCLGSVNVEIHANCFETYRHFF